MSEYDGRFDSLSTARPGSRTRCARRSSDGAGRDNRARIRSRCRPACALRRCTTACRRAPPPDRRSRARSFPACLRDGLAALLLGRPRRFAHDRHRGVADAVGQRFPALDRDALPAGLRNQPRYRAYRVEVFDDHARVVERRAVVEHQHRHLAERIVRRHDRSLAHGDASTSSQSIFFSASAMRTLRAYGLVGDASSFIVDCQGWNGVAQDGQCRRYAQQD